MKDVVFERIQMIEALQQNSVSYLLLVRLGINELVESVNRKARLGRNENAVMCWVQLQSRMQQFEAKACLPTTGLAAHFRQKPRL